MPFRYVTLEEAMQHPGLRMVVVGNIPSPWGEAAKSIFHLKGIDWVAVRLAYDSEAMKDWIGQRSGPVAIFEKERPRAGWAEILLLAERIAPAPSLLPGDAAERALAFGLSHEICGEQGLGWSRRLQLIHAGMHGAGGFDERAGRYLGRKYGYTPATGAAAGARVCALLGMLAARLRDQRAAGSSYFIGGALTVVDIYCATFMGLFAPLPHEVCAMDVATRKALETRDPPTDAALVPMLLEHREMMYSRHLVLPLSL